MTQTHIAVKNVEKHLRASGLAPTHVLLEKIKEIQINISTMDIEEVLDKIDEIAEETGIPFDVLINPIKPERPPTCAWRRKDNAQTGALSIEDAIKFENKILDFIGLIDIVTKDKDADRGVKAEIKNKSDAENLAKKISTRIKEESFAGHLRGFIEGEFDCPVFYAPGNWLKDGGVFFDKISGATIGADNGLRMIIINSQDIKRRAFFTLAHEFFHVLTWNQLPPSRIEGGNGKGTAEAKRIERLADCFAAELLMPKQFFFDFSTAFLKNQKIDLAGAVEIANRFSVTIQAAALRMRGLGIIDEENEKSLKNYGYRELNAMSLSPPNEKQDAMFMSKRFLLTIRDGCADGSFSIERACDAIKTSKEDFFLALEENDIPLPF